MGSSGSLGGRTKAGWVYVLKLFHGPRGQYMGRTSLGGEGSCEGVAVAWDFWVSMEMEINRSMGEVLRR